MIGTTELLLLGALALLIFGGKKVPEMMRGLGQGVKEFRKGMSEPENHHPDSDKEDQISDNKDSNKTSLEEDPSDEN